MANTINFIEKDFHSTLFPLKTNLIMAKNHSTELSEYIYQKILNNEFEGDNFLSQQKVYATKPKGHLRRTVKLDPVAEYFIYDLIFRNKSIFRKKVSETRQSFGYRFVDGNFISVHDAYDEYKIHLSNCSAQYSHNIQFDIASYFNSVYHHDIANWFTNKASVSEVDSNAFGKFFREINSGRSIDFLPHGIYPCKMIGNEFLKCIDLNMILKSSEIVRFMDDFTLFDNNPEVLKQDFINIQHILGKYALNINPCKTHYDNKVGNVPETLSNIRKSLQEIVKDYEEIHTASGVELVETEVIQDKVLSKEQIDGLLSLLKEDDLEESDADLILSFLRVHSDSIIELLPNLLIKFPNLIKHIHSLCKNIDDKDSLSEVINNYLNTQVNFLEYQLFWIGTILEDHLKGKKLYGESLIKVFELSSAFNISRAKILEIPEQNFGLKEIRDDYLKTGQSDWLSWASAMGSRELKANERNYVLNYFSKGSPMNYLISSCVQKL